VIINKLAERGSIDRERRARWKRLKWERNRFYHEDTLPTRQEIRGTLTEVDWLEQTISRMENGDLDSKA
jgi:hypothetical protein